MNNTSQCTYLASSPSFIMANKPTMKILLVEDSALLREIITESLEDSPYLTIEAYAATQSRAIELLSQTSFDMILVDIELAEGNGFEVIKFTQTPSYLHTRPVVVMFTNHANPYYRNLAKSLQIPYFYDKSMDFDLAIETIEQTAERFANN